MIKKILFLSLLLIPLTDLLSQREKRIKDNDKLNATVDSVQKYLGRDVDNTDMYLKKLKKEANKEEHILALALYYEFNGIYEEQLGLYDEALKSYNEARKLFSEVSNDKELTRLDLTQSTYHMDIGEYPEALELCYKGLKSSEAEQDSVMISKFYSNLALTHHYLHDNNEALKYAELGLQFKPKTSSPTSFGISYLNKGMYHQQLGQTAEELASTLKARDLFIQNENYSFLSQAYINLAWTYMRENNLKDANENIQLAIDAVQQSGDKMREAATYNTLAYYYLNFKQEDSLKVAVEKAIEIASTTKNYRILLVSYEILHEYYLNTRKDTVAAYPYLNLMKAYNDSLLDQTKINLTKNLNARYESEKKENIILQLENESLQKSRQVFMLIVSIVILGLISILIFVYVRHRNKYRLDQMKIEEQKRGIHAVLLAQENERQKIARDLHDSIGQQLSLLKRSLESFFNKLIQNDESMKGETMKLTESIDDAINESRSISHQMMPRTLKEFGLVPAVKDLLETVKSSSNINYEFEHYVEDERLQEKIEISIYRILQELVNNLIKHSGATYVNMMLHKTDTRLTLLMEDNGKGLKNEISEGIGMFNIKSRLDMLKGRINFESPDTGGTMANIIIPLDGK